MKVMRRSRWLARLAAMLVVGVAGLVVAASAPLRSDGTVWAWGQNDRGQLGNGTTVSTMTPVKVTGLSHVTGIAAGYNAAVATATNGVSAVTSVWTWGANDHGQLGDGTLADHLTAERITGIGTVYLAGVTAGLWTGTVLGADGSVWGWGDDSAGQLANGSTAPVTGPVQVTGLTATTQVAAGGRSFSLAVHTVPYLVGL